MAVLAVYRAKLIGTGGMAALCGAAVAPLPRRKCRPRRVALLKRTWRLRAAGAAAVAAGPCVAACYRMALQARGCSCTRSVVIITGQGLPLPTLPDGEAGVAVSGLRCRRGGGAGTELPIAGPDLGMVSGCLHHAASRRGWGRAYGQRAACPAG